MRAGLDAQAGEEGKASEPHVVEAVPELDSAPQEPALRLTLDDARVEVAPGYPPTFDEMELRVKRARIGLIVSAGVSVAGFVVVAASPNTSEWVSVSELVGLSLVVGGVLAVVATGALLGVRKGKLRRARGARYGAARRVEWDTARPQLVF